MTTGDSENCETGNKATESQLPAVLTQALSALEAVTDAVIFVDRDSRLTYANGAARQLFGKPQEAIPGLSLCELYPKPQTALFYQNYKKALFDDRPVKFREPVKMFNRWLEISMQPSTEGVAICFHNVTPEVFIEEVHMIAFLLTEKLKDIVLIVRAGGEIFYANQETCSALGYDRDDLLSLSIADIDLGCDHCTFTDRWNQICESGSASFETAYRTKEGASIPVDVTINHLKYHGTEYCCIGARDITMRKKAENELKRSNHEKELLLKEIHHRVKNNLQIISSLLSLQSMNVDKTNVAASFSDSQSRIKSMALIHEKLYRSKDLSYVDFQDYAQSLIQSLTRSYCTNPEVSIEVDIKNISLDIDSAIPCGLIINELVSNSLKYAFKDGRAGIIRISLINDQDQHVLTVSDNGVGIPPDIDYRNTASLGLQLVVTLAEQLNGKIELINDQGTTFRIKF